MVSHPFGTHLPSEPLFSVLWPIQTKFFSPLSFLPVLPCTQATRALRDLPWGLATRGSSAAGMVE